MDGHDEMSFEDARSSFQWVVYKATLVIRPVGCASGILCRFVREYRQAKEVVGRDPLPLLH